MRVKVKSTTREIGYTDTGVWVLLLLPDPSGDSELELFPVSAGEEESHVSLNYESVVAVSHFPVAVSDASRRSLPYQLPTVSADLEAVAIVPSLVLVSHEPQERHIHRSHSQLERLEVEAEILPETMEHRKHPRGVLYFAGIGLDVAVVESATGMHVDLVIVPEMGDEERDIPGVATLRPRIGTAVRSEIAHRLVLELAVVREYLGASVGDVLARKLERLGNFLESQTPYVSQLLSTCWAPIVYPRFTRRAQCVSVVALVNGRVHGIGTDGTLEQFMDAGGRSGVGSGTRRAGVRRRDAIIGSSLRRRKLRVVSVDDMVRVRVHRIIVDLVFVQSIRRGNAFNAIQIHTKILDRQKPLKKRKKDS